MTITYLPEGRKKTKPTTNVTSWGEEEEEEAFENEAVGDVFNFPPLSLTHQHK